MQYKSNEKLWLLSIACKIKSEVLSSAHRLSGRPEFSTQLSTSSRKWLSHSEPLHPHLKNEGLHEPLDVHWDRHNIISLELVPKCTAESNYEETSDKTKLKEILWINWPVKNVKLMKDKERLRNYSRLEVTKGTWQLNAECGMGLDPRPGKTM